MKLKIVRPSINFYLCQLPIRGHSNITSAFLATFRSVLLLCVIYCQIIRLRKRWPDTISYCELINSGPYRRGKHEVSGSTDPDFVDQEFKKSCETPHQSSFTVQFVNCASLHSGMHYRLATAASPQNQTGTSSAVREPHFTARRRALSGQKGNGRGKKRVQLPLSEISGVCLIRN